MGRILLVHTAFLQMAAFPLVDTACRRGTGILASPQTAERPRHMAASYRHMAASYRLAAASYRLEVASFRLVVASFRLVVAFHPCVLVVPSPSSQGP